jgi:predicted DsbA family dithiol-disulfide isomerase
MGIFIQQKVVADKAWEIVENAGLDLVQAKKDMNSETINERLQQEKEDIRTLRVSKTPTFFVNEQALKQFGAKELYELVISELEKQ